MNIIIEEISIAHNLQLIARAQCFYRKIQNKYIHKNKKEEQTEHTRISQLPYHRQSHNLKKRKKLKKKKKRKKKKKKKKKAQNNHQQEKVRKP